MSGKPVFGFAALVTVVGASAAGASAPAIEGPLPVVPVTISVGALAVSQFSEAQTQTYIAAFSNSAYGYCDAKKVAHVWGTDIYAAKAVIGSKIVGGLTHLLDQDIASTAASVPCSFADMGLTYDQAVALSDLWGVSVWEAKEQAATVGSQVGHKGFHEAFGEYLWAIDAGVDTHDGPPPTDDGRRSTFYDSEYGWCDATKVAHVWGIDSWDAKAVIGGKIQNGLTDLLDADIASTAGTVRCQWNEHGLVYQDMEQLAGIWGLNVAQTKTKVDTLLTRLGGKGFDEVVPDELVRMYP